MAHFARLNDDSIITELIVVSDFDCLDSNGNESEQVGAAFCHKLFGGNWLKVSYTGKTRGIYPPIGGYYDAELDSFFYEKKPFESWIPAGDGWWKAPIEKPMSRGEYEWDEKIKSWRLLPPRMGTPTETSLTEMLAVSWDDEAQTYVVDMFDGKTAELSTSLIEDIAATAGNAPIYEWDEGTQTWKVVAEE